MKDIFRYAWYQQLFGIFKSVNGFFYYLRKIPLIGKQIPDKIYKSYGFKRALFWIVGILSIPLRIFAKYVWLASYVFIANLAIQLVNGSDDFFHFQKESFLIGFLIWLLFTSFTIRLGKALDKAFLKPDRDFVQEFRLSWSVYIQKQALIDPLIVAVSYFPALVTFSILGKNILYLLVGFTGILAWNLAGSAGQRFLYKNGIRHHWTVYLFPSLIAISCIVALVYYYRWISPLSLIAVLALQVLVLLYSYRSIITFTDFEGFLTLFNEEAEINERELFELTKGNEYTRQGLAMQKKLTLEKKKDLSHLTGMTYLNALLFQRYNSILRKKFITRMSFIMGVLLVGQIAIGYSGVILTDKEITAIIPFLFLAMYALSLGRAIAQMVFVNCDISMLHYPFYRKAGNIIAGFNFRWLRSFQFNICFAAGLYLLLQCWSRLSLSLETSLLLALLLISLTALLSFHDLFIYYVLQPFTKDMEVVNPFYKILSGGLYWVAYINTRFDHINSQLYVLVISGILFLYVGIGYLILVKVAPKTFALKE